jgi:hypothetical protein
MRSDRSDARATRASQRSPKPFPGAASSTATKLTIVNASGNETPSLGGRIIAAVPFGGPTVDSPETRYLRVRLALLLSGGADPLSTLVLGIGSGINGSDYRSGLTR